jgi:hypothetical protein
MDFGNISTTNAMVSNVTNQVSDSTIIVPCTRSARNGRFIPRAKFEEGLITAGTAGTKFRETARLENCYKRTPPAQQIRDTDATRILQLKPHHYRHEYGSGLTTLELIVSYSIFMGALTFAKAHHATTFGGLKGQRLVLEASTRTLGMQDAAQ